jgi:hypothetical protein
MLHVAHLLCDVSNPTQLAPPPPPSLLLLQQLLLNTPCHITAAGRR